MEMAATQSLYDPVSEQAHVNPYPLYERLRDEHPLYYVPEHDVWALSRYADIKAGLRDWETFSSAQGVELGTYVQFFGPGSIQELDPPHHDVLRKVLAPRFMNKAIKSYEPVIRATARDLVEPMSGESQVDLGYAFTQKLPILTIFRILGIPQSDIDWTVSAGLEMLNRPPGQSGPSARAHELRGQLVAYFDELVAARRGGNTTDDVFGDMAQAIDAGIMQPEEVQGLALLLIAAGMETTTSLMGNMVHALATNLVTAEQMLDADGEPSAATMDEFLRFDSPAQWLARVTTKPVTLHGFDLPVGSRVLMIFASGNRDPREFERADELVLDRDGSRNLAFGEGVHFCLGMPLAKLEARVGMTELVGGVGEFSLAGEPVRYPSHVIRGYESIPVSLQR